MEKITVLSKPKTYFWQRSIFIMAFLIPLLIPGPQILTGTLVNCLLLLSLDFIDQKQRLVISVLPSTAAIFHGLIFASFTKFLLYFWPFIWLANWLYLNSLTWLQKTQKPAFALLFAAILKSAILFITAWLLTNLKLVPNVFLLNMGIWQLLTALSGGTLALLIKKMIAK